MDKDRNIKVLEFCIDNKIEMLDCSNSPHFKCYGLIVIQTNFQDNCIFMLASSESQYEQLKANALNQIKNDNTVIDCEGYIITEYENPEYKYNIDYIYRDYINIINK